MLLDHVWVADTRPSSRYKAPMICHPNLPDAELSLNSSCRRSVMPQLRLAQQINCGSEICTKISLAVLQARAHYAHNLPTTLYIRGNFCKQQPGSSAVAYHACGRPCCAAPLRLMPQQTRPLSGGVARRRH